MPSLNHSSQGDQNLQQAPNPHAVGKHADSLHVHLHSTHGAGQTHAWHSPPCTVPQEATAGGWQPAAARGLRVCVGSTALREGSCVGRTGPTRPWRWQRPPERGTAGSLALRHPTTPPPSSPSPAYLRAGLGSARPDAGLGPCPAAPRAGAGSGAGAGGRARPSPAHGDAGPSPSGPPQLRMRRPQRREWAGRGG